MSTTCKTTSSSDTLDLRRFLRSVRNLKWIYVASFIFFMGMAATYCILRQPQYEINSTMLIEDPSADGSGAAGGMAMMMRTFSVGGFSGSSVNNELQLINSHEVLMNTAKTLGLNRTYYRRDGMEKRMLFLDSPIALEAPQTILDTLRVGMTVTVDIKGDRADIDVTRGRFKTTVAAASDATLPATVKTPWGPLTIIPTSNYTGEEQTIQIDLGSYEGAAAFLYSDIDVSVPDKLADAIGFGMLYPNPARGRAILNTLMAEYNAKRLERKHATARAQLEFLDERINSIFGELNEAEQKLQDFKSEHKIVSIGAEAPLLLESTYSAQTDMVKVSAEVAYYREVLAALASPERSGELLPVFDSAAYPMIRDYNTMLMEKKDLERSATPSNPVLIAAETNLAEMRASVTNNVENMLQAAETLLASQKALAAKADAKLNTLPAAERDYVTLTRDRQLKNELYTYLAAQRENAALQIYNDDTLGFIVDEAYSSIRPSNRKAYLAIAGCLFMAFLCPTLLALLLTWRKRSVCDPMDAASSGIEPETVVIDGSRASINSLRALIMRHSEGAAATVYVSGDAASSIVSGLAEAFGAIGRDSASLTPAMMGLDDDNDSLFLPAFRKRMADIATATAPTTLFIPVPVPGRTAELRPLFDGGGASAMLLLAYTRGSLPIATLKATASLFSGITVMLAIVKE